MLANVITFDSGIAAIATPSEQDYERFSESANGSIYHGPLHTDGSRDIIAFKRNEPQASGNFRGTRKVSAKITRDMSVPGVDTTSTVVAPFICELSVSTPIGLEDEDIDAYLNLAIGMLMSAEVRDDLILERHV
jgi:hypothetical protein